jgi:hypothetical protein
MSHWRLAGIVDFFHLALGIQDPTHGEYVLYD